MNVAGDENRRFPWRTGVVCGEWLLLWSKLYVALLLLGWLESQAMRVLFDTYHHTESWQLVSVVGLSASADGHTLAARMSFRRGENRSSIINDVVVHNLPQRSVRCLRLGDLQPTLVTVSPGADIVAIACQNGEILAQLLDDAGAGWPERRLVPLPATGDPNIWLLKFSPDAHWLAVVDSNHTSLLRVPPRAQGCCPTASGVLAVSPSLPSYAPVKSGGNSEASSDCTIIYSSTEAIRLPTSLAFSSDGRQMVSLNDCGEVDWWNVPTGQHVQKLSLANSPVFQTALACDGRLAALVDGDQVLHCWDLDTAERCWQRSQEEGGWHLPLPRALAFSPDGRLLVAACWTNGRHIVRCYDVESGHCVGAEPRYVADFKGLIVASCREFYTWDSTLGVQTWDVRKSRPVSKFLWQPEFYR